VAWAPGGQRLALPHAGGVDFWSIPDHKLLLASEKVEAWISDLDWSPNGRVVAASTGNGSMAFVHSSTGKNLITIYPHTSYFAADWSPDGSRIATGGSDGVLKILDAATADELVTLVADGDAISSVAWSPDRRRLASADVAGMIRLWGSVDMPEMTQTIDHLGHGVLASVK
jgi:WD40 repeat protein